MDIFEKQQRVESVRGIVKARWIAIFLIVSLGYVLKIKYFGSWGTGFNFFNMFILGIFAAGYNFAYWLYIRRPIEKITERGLSIITALQVIVDDLIFTVLYYYSGTVEGVTFLLYFIIILIASSLYKARGIILSGILAVLLCVGTTFLDYYKVIPHIYSFPGKVGWFGDYYMTVSKSISFAFYMAVAVTFSVFLSDLIRRRERRLKDKQDSLIQQSQVLTSQTQELTKTKDYLHEALTKSDKARIESEKARAEANSAKEDLEKANLELQAKLRELEKYGQVTTGRELRMAELKKKIKSMEERINELEQQITEK